MTSRALLGLMITAVAFGTAPARAELPPGSYDKLRGKASEAIIIEVQRVTSKEIRVGWSDVVLTARVVAVERSKAGLKMGATVTIRYQARDPAKVNFAGPRPVPILKQGEVYPAFLNHNVGRGDFEPAAFGASFLMTPEG